MKENGGGVLYGVHLAAIRARLLGTFPSFSSAALGDRPVVRTPYLTPGHGYTVQMGRCFLGQQLSFFATVTEQLFH